MFRTACFVAVTAILLLSCASQGSSRSAPAAQHSAKTSIATAPHWIQYKDLAEGAFSMDVPAGWQVQGGMWRFGYFDARWMMTVRTLDGAMLIRLDDVSVPPYALPGPYTGQAGQPYAKPQQFQMMVEDYKTADDYARIYAQHRFKSVCKSLTQKPGDAWQPTMPSEFALTGNVQKSTQASLSFACDTSQGQRIATVYVRTTQIGVSYGTGFWGTEPLISILTTKQDEHAAYAIAQHMLNSWRKSPQWVAYQNKLTKMGLEQIQENYQEFLRQTQAIMQRFQSSMSAQVNGFEARQHMQAAQFNEFDQALVGIQDATDPLTGEQLQVFTGPHSHNYRNGLGQEINSDISPGPDYHCVTGC